MVRTSPFHGGNESSILSRDTKYLIKIIHTMSNENIVKNFNTIDTIMAKIIYDNYINNSLTANQEKCVKIIRKAVNDFYTEQERLKYSKIAQR